MSLPNNKHRIAYGDTEFTYQLCFVASKQVDKHRKILVHVHPNGLVQVDAPEGANLSEINTAVRKRARWVIEHLEAIAKRNKHILPREYVSGETVFYLGRRYVLKVLRNDDKPTVKLKRGQLVVEGTGLDTADAVKKLLKKWYRTRAAEVFKRRLTMVVDKCIWCKQEPEWKLLTMKRQWGSCSPSGTLSLNPHLVKAPTECIDYVLLHELCHLQEHNHSPRFYNLLSRQMPHWQSVKTRLDGMAELILNE
ncbi:M48 family metallopeptidase [Halodesulfovibrio sp. MK-HDV]|jgi:predicted metal-dependent hydrolase|uniref:M48 family metallopeptidase n=1 Tax=Halodesulfovibrio sp. MK-HDV TaxID=2599925 RepID=UPI00136C1273|nr:SprT family zinc-dependent metalloprotease [Halodesulfovibrio sp. MK-HDV]KAF1077462.1 hypothetical protein MKHDV_00528 [Halodesulfovibrio sp. MK-HDV]